MSVLKLNTWFAAALRKVSDNNLRKNLKAPFQVHGFEHWQSLRVGVGCVLWITKCHIDALFILNFHLVKQCTNSVKYLLPIDLFSDSLLIWSDSG